MLNEIEQAKIYNNKQNSESEKNSEPLKEKTTNDQIIRNILLEVHNKQNETSSNPVLETSKGKSR